MDLFLLLHTGYTAIYNFKKKFVMDGRLVARYYWRHHSMFTDIIALVPYYIEVILALTTYATPVVSWFLVVTTLTWIWGENCIETYLGTTGNNQRLSVSAAASFVQYLSYTHWNRTAKLQSYHRDVHAWSWYCSLYIQLLGQAHIVWTGKAYFCMCVCNGIWSSLMDQLNWPVLRFLICEMSFGFLATALLRWCIDQDVFQANVVFINRPK